jgi:hypothetical protein
LARPVAMQPLTITIAVTACGGKRMMKSIGTS